MSIIIQTGHSSSYSDKLMQMLYERGLGAPMKSHAHDLSAEEITEKLTKILNKNTSIINTKMIDNLMVDLLLANLDQDDWGWADVNNIDTLSYWQQSDDNVRFILVFDSPKLLLKHLLGQNITPELVEAAITDWVVYHEKILMFFEQQSHHCLLIEGDLAVKNLANIKDQIQAIATNLKLKSDWQIQELGSGTQEIVATNAMFEIVANEILKQYPECLALYEKLIEKSTIHLKHKHVPTTNHLTSLIDSLNLFNEQEEFKKKLMTQNEFLQGQLLILMNEKQSLEQQLKDNVLLLEQSKNSANAKQTAKIEQTEQENRLLITQLHQVQEELERYYLENQKIKQNQKPAKPVYYGAADRVKEDLPYRLGATMVSHSKSAKDLVTLPLALAKEYREFNKNRPAENLPAIEDYQDAHEAEKVKKHLSYRLGKTLVDGLKSPKNVIELPVRFGKEIARFNKK